MNRNLEISGTSQDGFQRFSTIPIPGQGHFSEGKRRIDAAYFTIRSSWFPRWLAVILSTKSIIASVFFKKAVNG